MCEYLNEFMQIKFPVQPNIVYVICYKKDDRKEIPFYVGKSTRSIGRIGDYVSANFSAQTDFKVGKAIDYLREERGYEIIVRYLECNNIDEKEKEMIRAIESDGYKLLNNIDLLYDYNVDNPEGVKNILITKIGLELLG